MLRIPIALIGVNLTENENIFLGIFMKINEANEVLVLVDNSPSFTDRVNDIITSIKKLYKTSKDFASFFKSIKDISSSTRFMLYDRLMPISNDGASVDMVVGEAKKLYMSVFSNVNVIVKGEEKKEEKTESKVPKKQLKVKEENK